MLESASKWRLHPSWLRTTAPAAGWSSLDENVRETGRLQQKACAVTEISSQVVQPGPTPYIGRAFTEPDGITKVPGIGHLRSMRLHFALELALETTSVEERPQAPAGTREDGDHFFARHADDRPGGRDARGIV
jgi:hypothetical protein